MRQVQIIPDRKAATLCRSRSNDAFTDFHTTHKNRYVPFHDSSHLKELVFWVRPLYDTNRMANAFDRWFETDLCQLEDYNRNIRWPPRLVQTDLPNAKIRTWHRILITVGRPNKVRFPVVYVVSISAIRIAIY